MRRRGRPTSVGGGSGEGEESHAWKDLDLYPLIGTFIIFTMVFL